MYDPEIWLESTIREIKGYVMGGFTAAVTDSNGAPSGDEIYDVVMEFPGPALDNAEIPMSKTIIHFEIDDSEDRLVGLGDNAFAANYDSVTQTINPQYGRWHQINFDVGIWTSAKAGGTTARLRARQILEDLLGSVRGQNNLREISDGGDGSVEILSFTGGRYILDSINDVPIYRMIDCQLRVRVFSRTKLRVDEASPSIETITQAPNLTILG